MKVINTQNSFLLRYFARLLSYVLLRLIISVVSLMETVYWCATVHLSPTLLLVILC